MKLHTALLIAQDCYLKTVGEAIYNIDIHAGSMFPYNRMADELEELYMDFSELEKSIRITVDSKINDVLHIIEENEVNI